MLAAMSNWAARRALRRWRSAPVLVVTGQPGVGKTAFALVAANQLSGAPETQVQIVARLGADGRQPRFPEQILQSLLIRLGVPEAEVGRDLEALQARYRAELHGKRALVCCA